MDASALVRALVAHVVAARERVSLVDVARALIAFALCAGGWFLVARARAGRRGERGGGDDALASKGALASVSKESGIAVAASGGAILLRALAARCVRPWWARVRSYTWARRNWRGTCSGRRR